MKCYVEKKGMNVFYVDKMFCNNINNIYNIIDRWTQTIANKHQVGFSVKWQDEWEGGGTGWHGKGIKWFLAISS